MIKINFKVEIGQRFKNENRDLTIIDKEIRRKIYTRKNGKLNKNNFKYYKYHCNKCNAELWIEENKLLKMNRGCGCCYGRVVVKGINDIATTHPHLVKYFVNIEDAYTHTYASNKKILFKCPDCDFEKEMNVNTLYGQGFSCKKCGDGISYPNKFMFNILEQLNIDFKTEYSPEWIAPKRYDFYIPSKKLIIEMDGGFHNKDNNRSGKTKEESLKIDKHKDKLADEHKLKVIRVDCDYNSIVDRFNYIKNNVMSKLTTFFNLDIINWNNINEYCEKNLVKEVCKYWDNKKEIETIKDLQKIFQLEESTIRNYLKIGTNLQWCQYSAKEEKAKSLNKIINKRSKQIEIFNENKQSLGVFSSIAELSRNSEELFGVKLVASEISKAVRCKDKIYKNYFFDKDGYIN